jgi:3-methyladenine DNA glycosylase AlkC
VPSKLKDFFDETLVRAIGDDIHRAFPSLDRKAFVADCLRGLDGLELIDRGRHIGDVLRRHLPEPFEEAARILVASLGPALPRTEDFGMAPFRYLPHIAYVGRYGLDHFEAAMDAQMAITQRFSAEWSIRGFLERYPQKTYARLLDWVRHPSVHVRRLVSEGTRPRLPWAPRLRVFQEDPAPVIRLLELLKDDPELYVRRSVANSLNDIGKDHPQLLVEVCRRWSVDAPPERAWVIQHALRSLVKRGDRDALAVLGVAKAPRVRVSRARLAERRVPIGGALAFSFDVESTARRAQDLLVDFAVHFVKADGSTKPKVFKLARITLPAGGRVTLRDRVSFRPMTTRKHYSGTHRLEALINGVVFPLARFEVAAAPRRLRVR